MSRVVSRKQFLAMAEKVYRRMNVETVEIQPEIVAYGIGDDGNFVDHIATGLVRVTMRGSYWQTSSTRRARAPKKTSTTRTRR
jgi:membrane protein implicated in regulation of membrane protease activity